jgi:hypothetical protein
VIGQAREVQMVSYMPVKAGHDARSVYATITRIVGGYTVTVAMRETGRTRVLVEKTVDSHFAAETVARAYATQNNFPWQRVQLVSR